VPGAEQKRDAEKPRKLPLDAESSFYSALPGDDFSPGTAEFQQLTKRAGISLKKNTVNRTRGG
jgi:hypothetical protein